MQFLPQTVIGAAGTFIGPTTTFNLNLPRALTAQASFIYGAGGTTCDAYLQTNVNGGAIAWCDVSHFAFTTTQLLSVAKTAADVAFTQGAPTDGALAAGTTNSIVGPLWRVKYVTAGTYAPAAGTITFVSNPSNGATVTISGTLVTFTTGTPTGNQVPISAVNLAGTLTNLVQFLSTSNDVNISKASYVASATVLTVTYTGIGPFALAASVATAVSGGGLTALQVDAAPVM